MYYFDKDFLAQYITTDVEVEVFADREWYKLTSLDDLENDSYMVGYDGTGKPHTIDYKEITQISAYDNVITIDALQDKMYDQPPADDKNQPVDDAEPEIAPDATSPQDASQEEPEEETEDPNVKKTPREAYEMVGKMINESISGYGISKNDTVINIKEGSENYGKRGTVTTVYGNIIQYRTISGGNTAICVDKVEHLKVI